MRTFLSTLARDAEPGPSLFGMRVMFRLDKNQVTDLVGGYE